MAQDAKKKDSVSQVRPIQWFNPVSITTWEPGQEMPQVLGQPDPGQLQTEILSQMIKDSVLCYLKYTKQPIPRVPGK